MFLQIAYWKVRNLQVITYDHAIMHKRKQKLEIPTVCIIDVLAMDVNTCRNAFACSS